MKEMKIIKEHKLGDEPWYSLQVEDKYVTGSYDLEKIEIFFDEIKRNPNLHLKSKEVIKSTIINID